MFANLHTQIKNIWNAFKRWVTQKPLTFLLLTATVSTFSVLILIGDKSLWEWAQLLIVPTALAAAGYFFSKSQKKVELEIAQAERDTDREIALERQRQNTLEKYFDRMKELLLDRGLTKTDGDEIVKKLARTLTINVLSELGADRNRLVIQFLHETELLTTQDGGKPAMQLQNANLRGANLSKADLHGTNLRGASLRAANLLWANLSGADLRAANLRGANLAEADLRGAYLQKARYSTNTKWPNDFDPIAAGALNVESDERN